MSRGRPSPSRRPWRSLPANVAGGRTLINTILTRIFGTRNEREIKRMRALLARVDELESGLRALSDAELQAKTGEFKRRLGTDGGGGTETLDDILPEAF